ncbi:hypothetical protein [Paraburkholderia caballeronis]|uniref:hypothetical protein n=1 Tax=Paraburkholderia caballeronis TaxID=416943 RepID=UPI0010655B2B|nr:hypothetical protein [Paraburkholderia caballeronis]TDV17316.1 hypothetical protein C7406_106244 [Paraburkholderia caballeronis]TDV17701.1 hypothetical protein C7408_104365 [Paraburkholderia caballeronis]TDV27719.1 hypothetical protein C7404_104365 [Paraburkholderia caballeronis]
MTRQLKEALPDGEYWATCRERNEIAAALNGHSQVFPQARVIVKNGWANFYRDGVEVWACNPVYAKSNFIIQAEKD